jgi:RimJ/RimL family protein N-acetyltransferase
MRDPIETERLVLRPFTADDVDHLVTLNSDPDVMRFLTNGNPTAREKIEQEILPTWLSYQEQYDHLGYWALQERESSAFLGWIAIEPRNASGDADGTQAELEYRLVKRAWGNGFATEGSVALIAAAFAEPSVTRVWARTMAVNSLARSVLERSGLSFVRTVHEKLDDPIDGTEQGEVEYELTRETWENARR